jgi:hypothetical protein
MKRSRTSPEMIAFNRKLTLAGFEKYARLSNPLLIHKAYTPINRDTCWLVFFARPNGKLTKKQELGKKLWHDLGIKTFVYVPEKPINPTEN